MPTQIKISSHDSRVVAQMVTPSDASETISDTVHWLWTAAKYGWGIIDDDWHEAAQKEGAENLTDWVLKLRNDRYNDYDITAVGQVVGGPLTLQVRDETKFGVVTWTLEICFLR